MVYDTESQAVNGCTVALDDGGTSTTTEVNGRFFFDFVPFGKHTLTLTKDGYERYASEIDFSSRTQVAHIRIFSYSSLLSKVEEAIEDREWDRARTTLSRASAVKADEPFAVYLGAVIDYRNGSFDAALSSLEGLLGRGYREPFVMLFLADIYQFKKHDMEKAESFLIDYLALREDGAARKRLDELKTSE